MHYALKEFCGAPVASVADAISPWTIPSETAARAADDGSPAPRTHAGLSKLHNTTPARHTVTVHVGGSLLELKRPRDAGDAWNGQDPPQRDVITCFSGKSRQRLRMDLAKVDQNKAGKCLFCTLTYPNEFPTDAKRFKAHLESFAQRFRRAYPLAAFHWKLEFQDRDAPHFHPMVWRIATDRDSVRAFRDWLKQAWYEVVGSNDPKHLQAGTQADLMRSQFGIMRYVGPYLSKNDQSRPGWSVGRYWGVVARANIPYAIAPQVTLSPAESLRVWRTARKYQRACNRQRRIVRVTKKGIEREQFFNGQARQLRKRGWKLDLPRKLTLKANDNINLFCDARQWAIALERLIQ